MLTHTLLRLVVLAATLAQTRAPLHPSANPPSSASGSTPPAAARTADTTTAPPAFQAASLGELDAECMHGLALCKARDGDLSGATTTLAEVVRIAPGNALAPRDLARVKALLVLRDAWIESVRASGAKVSFEIAGKKLVAAIDHVEGDAVHLKPNARKLDTIPLSTLDAAFVAREADKKEEQGGTAPSVRAFAFALAGDPRWQKTIKDAADDAALQGDATRDYPSLLRTGEAASVLSALARRAEPKDASEAMSCLDEITALYRKSGDLSAVQRRKPALARLAEAAAFRAFTLKDVASLVHGAAGDYGTGEDIKVAYEFDSPAELEDFEPADGYLKAWHAPIAKKGGTPSENQWQIADGNLRCAGLVCYRYRIPFAAPMHIRFDYRTESGEGDDELIALYIAFCAQGESAYVLSSPAGDVMAYDEKASDSKSATGKLKGPFFHNSDYRLDIRHDGKVVKTTLDGEEQAELPAGSITRGYVYVWLHTNRTYVIHRLELEGRVDPILLRAQWIDTQLKAAGLR